MDRDIILPEHSVAAGADASTVGRAIWVHTIYKEHKEGDEGTEGSYEGGGGGGRDPCGGRRRRSCVRPSLHPSMRPRTWCTAVIRADTVPPVANDRRICPNGRHEGRDPPQ